MSDKKEISSFDFARLATLKQYADLELEVCLVMKQLLGVPESKARAVFYQISNTRARYAIIGNLAAKEADGVFAKAWSKIERWLGPCDVARNHLVHWTEKESIMIKFKSGEGNKKKSAEHNQTLTNPSKIADPNSPTHYEKDIWARRDEMRVMHHIVNRYSLTLAAPDKWPWREIYQQPIADQTPIQLLERLNDAGHPAQLPPYEKKLLDRNSQDRERRGV